MSKLRTTIAVLTAAVAAVSAFAFSVSATADENSVPNTSLELVRDMGNGINLGNTMESCGSWIGGSTPTSYETAWGQPKTTKAMIDGMKAAGFNSVRIPVAWSNMMSDDGNYTIDTRYLDRVEEIVNYVLDNDMYAVVNDHWDGGWWEDFAATNSDKTANEAVRAEAMKKYKAIWTQVGERFKDYSHKLIFESANEELGDSFTNGEYWIKTKERYTLVTEINQAFVDLIRSQGGNNADRYLLIAGYNTDIVKTTDDKYVMPTDTVNDRLLISVHYYTPSTFCLVSDPNNSWGYSDTWGTDADIAEMRNYLEMMTKFTDQGIGVIIGEFGAFHGQNGLIKNGTYSFYDNMLKICEELNYCPMSWDCSEWYIRKEGKITDEKMAAVFKDNEYVPTDPVTDPTTETTAEPTTIDITDPGETTEPTSTDSTEATTADATTEAVITTASAGNTTTTAKSSTTTVAATNKKASTSSASTDKNVNTGSGSAVGITVIFAAASALAVITKKR